MSSNNTVVTVADPELTNCILVRGPHALVRLTPSQSITASNVLQWVTTTPPTSSKAVRPLHSQDGRTKDEMVALVRTEWGVKMTSCFKILHDKIVTYGGSPSPHV
jgi:hypothetical protein